MSTYKLPRTKSGEIDWNEVYRAAEDNCDVDCTCTCTDDGLFVCNSTMRMFKAIDANARKEEREACMAICDEYVVWHNVNDDGLSGFGHMATGAYECSDAIRNREEPK